MNLYPIFFLFVFVVGSAFSLLRGPIWGLLTYVFVYFNIPSQQWWGGDVPDIRWSLVTAVILIISCVRHRDQLVPKYAYRNTPFRYLLVLWILMIIIVPFGYDPSMAWDKIYDFFRYVLIFYLACRILSDFLKFKLFLLTILGCSFWLSNLARHYFTGTRLDGVGLPDASDANMLAALILLIIPSLIAFVFTGRKWERAIALLATPFIVNAFMMCRSRGAFIGFAAQLLLLLFRFSTQLKRNRFRIILASLILVAFFISLMDPQFRNRLFDFGDSTSDEHLAEVSAGRTAIWKSGIDMFLDYPFGAGGNAFIQLSPSYLPEQYIEKSVGGRSCHNTFLLVLVEQGIVGLLIYLLFIRSLFIILQKIKEKIKEFAFHEEHRVLHQGLLYHNLAIEAALAGFWIASVFVDRIYFEGVYLIAALVPGLFYISSVTIQHQVPAKVEISGKDDLQANRNNE